MRYTIPTGAGPRRPPRQEGAPHPAPLGATPNSPQNPWHSAAPTAAERASPKPPASWLSRLGYLRKLATCSYKSVFADWKHKEQRTQHKRMHKLLHANGKKAHAQILKAADGTDAPPLPPALTCVRDRAGEVLTDGPAVLAESAAQYAEAKQPPEPPDDRSPPWTSLTRGLVPCRLRTAAGSAPLAAYLNRAAFDRCLAQLQNRRAPGPNGLPSEIIKHAPQEYHDLLFDAFRLCLAAGRAPPSWKHSETILLFKRGDPTDLKNWRPIGLADSVVKLYHSVLADCMYRLCTDQGLLSDTQFGFRRDRNCHQALTYMLSLFEDSKATKRNLYVAYLDFSDAFGSLPQERITEVLQLLKLPQDAVAAVKDMYTGATTSLRLPAGLTDPIPFQRGTLQGDSLSPLIFLLFMEPLIQWLAAEDHGYHPGCGDHTSNQGRPDAPEPASSSFYADDAALISRSVEGLQVMLEKVNAYCAWSAMRINVDKSNVTGLEHTRPEGARGKTLRTRLETAMRVDGRKIPFIKPSEPYKYLGIWVTMSLSATDHAAHLIDDLTRRLAGIDNTPMFPTDSVRTLKSLALSKLCLLPAIGNVGTSPTGPTKAISAPLPQRV